MRTLRKFGLMFILFFVPGIISGFEIAAASAADDQASAFAGEQLPVLHIDGPDYRTPRAGEGFQTEVFGRQVTVQPTNRRSVTSMDIGVQVNVPDADTKAVIPFGAIYLWRHPDDKELFRADVVGLYNDVFFSNSSSFLAPFEWVLTFNSYTLPFAQYELVDGKADKNQELEWGYVRPGIGLGYRTGTSPGHQDNMLAVDLIVEPGFLIFGKSSNAASNFVLPHDVFELCENLQLRLDAFERNLLSLPHEGFAAGADLVHGNRTHWQNWGLNGSQLASGGHDYLLFTGYLLAAGGVPGSVSDRDRLIGSLHGGVGEHLDRFSAPRIGGGVLTLGEEYGSTWRTILPGSAIREFFPDHYVVAVGEYRREVLFFTYLSLDASAGWLDRLRRTGAVESSKNDVFSSLGARITTGFFFDTRMQLSYNYNFGVIRDGHYGGHEVVLHFSREL